ncbi:MAG: hypothetical protein B7Z80_03610 [Rhodospirillales bacterium 20-64-7]|nr:MAG: hypothetical protein B7Z80_03610 [Rhodospirillales bacterium 20-64-7]
MSDPATNFLSGIGELYLQGLQAWQQAARAVTEAGRPAQPGPRPASAGPLADLGQAFAAMSGNAQASYEDHFADATGGGAGETMSALGQAWMIAAGSALRYGQGLLDVQTRYQSALLRAAGAPSDRVTTDAFRGFLREVGETAEREARRLQFELEQLGEKIARASEHPADPETLNPRPYRAKE